MLSARCLFGLQGEQSRAERFLLGSLQKLPGPSCEQLWRVPADAALDSLASGSARDFLLSDVFSERHIQGELREPCYEQLWSVPHDATRDRSAPGSA